MEDVSVLQDCEISVYELQKILNKVVTKRKSHMTDPPFSLPVNSVVTVCL